MRGALEPQQLHIASDVHAEQQRELPMKVVRRERRHLGQPRHVQRLVQMRVDVREDVAQAGEVAVGGGGQCKGLLGGDTVAVAGGACLTDLARSATDLSAVFGAVLAARGVAGCFAAETVSNG